MYLGVVPEREVLMHLFVIISEILLKNFSFSILGSDVSHVMEEWLSVDYPILCVHSAVRDRGRISCIFLLQVRHMLSGLRKSGEDGLRWRYI